MSKVKCPRCQKEGVRVRKDGAMWRHWDGLRNETCEQVDPVSDPAPTVDTMDDTTFEDPTPHGDTTVDEFEDPTPAGPREQQLVERGRYLITDPATGEFRRYKTSGNINGYTRVTTFVKAATDSKALNDWGKRNVLIGAAARPDLAAKAYGLKNETENREKLDGLVEELYVAANAHIPSETGTTLHGFREDIDAGKMTLGDVPEKWRRNLEMYYEALEAYGLRPVPGLSERVTMTHKYGSVAGKFDQVYQHLASGAYLMGDLKTGKTMEYASKEVPCQLSIYTDGFNEFGVYDPDTKTWSRPVDENGNLVQLHTGIGLIFHMPVQGDMAGTFDIKDVDLDVGRRYAALCTENRTFKAPSLKTWDGVVPGAPEPRKQATWEERFASVTSSEGATALWREAKAAGIQGVALNELIALAQQALRQRLTIDHG